MKVDVPKLRKLPFENTIIERCRSRQISVEETIAEMYLAGVSVRRVEDITEVIWGTKVVGAFPDGNSAVMFAAARLHYVTSRTWGTRVYLNMKLLTDLEKSKEDQAAS